MSLTRRDGLIYTQDGKYLIERSHKNPKRAAYWRARDTTTGNVATGWYFTPALAAQRATPPAP